MGEAEEKGSSLKVEGLTSAEKERGVGIAMMVLM